MRQIPYNKIENYNEVMLEAAKIDRFATELLQHLQAHDKDFTESVSMIADNLAFGYVDDYVERLEAYAEDLDSAAAELARDVSMGAEEEVDADKAIDKYNSVMETMTKLKNLSLATGLQEHLQAHDKNFTEFVSTIAENLTNRNIDDYVERLEAYAEDLDSTAAELASYASVGALIDETETDKAIDKYNTVMEIMTQLKNLSKDTERIDLPTSDERNEDRVTENIGGSKPQSHDVGEEAQGRKKQKEKEKYEEEKYEEEKTEDYFKRREEIEEQKKRERRKKEEQKTEEKRKKENEQKKKAKNDGMIAISEMLLLKEFADLKSELSQVKTEIFSLRKELSSKEKSMETVSKKDTKKRAGR